MRLNELLKGIEYEILKGDNIDIKAIAYDSRKVSDVSMFVCVSGFVTDGCKYIDEAVKNGAKAIMVEQPIYLNKNVTIIKVKNSRYAMAIAISNLYNNPSKDIKLIGITGTNGKTTTSFLISSILKEAKKNVGLIGTIENHIGDKVLKSEHTTPEALELNQLFLEMKQNNINYVVMEVSSHSLALDRVSGCNFEIGIFTNLTQDHLDFHKTMDNYRKAKAKLFKMCKKGIINIDDVSSKYIADTASCDIIKFGINNNADFKAQNIKLSADGVNFDIIIDNRNINFCLPIPGKFNIYNTLAAIATCYSLSIPIETIQNGIKNTKTVAGRCQSIKTNKGFNIIVDYAHTPDGLENIITTVNEFNRGRTIVVFGCGGDRDKTKRAIMGEIAGNLSDFCIITSDNPRSENPESIIADIENGILKTKCSYIKIVDRKEAIKHALNLAQKNDIVVIAGKGHENYQIFKDKTIHFDDFEVANSFVQED